MTVSRTYSRVFKQDVFGLDWGTAQALTGFGKMALYSRAPSEFNSVLKTSVLIQIAWCSTTPRVPAPDLRSFLPGQISFLPSPVQHWTWKTLLFTALHLPVKSRAVKAGSHSLLPSSCSDQGLFAHTVAQSENHTVHLGFTGFSHLAPILPSAGVTGCKDLVLWCFASANPSQNLNFGSVFTWTKLMSLHEGKHDFVHWLCLALSFLWQLTQWVSILTLLQQANLPKISLSVG